MEWKGFTRLMSELGDVGGRKRVLKTIVTNEKRQSSKEVDQRPSMVSGLKRGRSERQGRVRGHNL